MTDDALHIHPRLRDHGYDRERVLDWLTALLPPTIVAVLYFGWQAAALAVVAVGGYLMAAYLLAWATKREPADLRFAPAALGGLLAAFFLSACAPLWAAALFGALTAAVGGLSALARERWKSDRFALPTVHPVVLAYVVMRLVFPSVFGAYTMPAQFSEAEGTIAATPLAALRGEEMSLELWQLFFGVHAGAIGEICTAALLLAATYLLLRRRIRLIAPACLLATVALLSWAIWGAPLYALLAGSLVLAAVLFADKTHTPAAPLDQAVIGVVAAVITVLMRRFGGWGEGAVVGVAAAQLLVPALPYIYRFCTFTWTHIAAWTTRAWLWAKPYIVRFLSFMAAKITAGAAAAWRGIRRSAKFALQKIKNLFDKRKNNS